jgi:hypothetical protein
LQDQLTGFARAFGKSVLLGLLRSTIRLDPTLSAKEFPSAQIARAHCVII